MHIMHDLVPELSEVHPHQAYDLALDDIRILSKCLEAFRENRDHFAPFLIDAAKRPVGDDGDMPLFCGRSLNQVVGIVVRSAARRYFRRRLPNLVADARRAAVLERRGVMVELIDTFRGPPPSSTVSKRIIEGDALYREIADYLHFDWQVPLVPAYAKLTVPQVRRLGANLLELRDAKSLAAAVAGKPIPEPEAGGQSRPQDLPTPVTAAPQKDVPEKEVPVFDPSRLTENELILSRLIDSGTGQVRITVLADALDKPHAQAALAANPLRRNAIIPPDITPGAIAVLVKLLDLRDEQIAVLLVTAYAMLGRDLFPTVFGASAKPAILRQLVERGRTNGIGRYTEPKAIATFIEAMFAKAREKILKVA